MSTQVMYQCKFSSNQKHNIIMSLHILAVKECPTAHHSMEWNFNGPSIKGLHLLRLLYKHVVWVLICNVQVLSLLITPNMESAISASN